MFNLWFKINCVNSYTLKNVRKLEKWSFLANDPEKICKIPRISSIFKILFLCRYAQKLTQILKYHQISKALRLSNWISLNNQISANVEIYLKLVNIYITIAVFTSVRPSSIHHVTSYFKFLQLYHKISLIKISWNVSWVRNVHFRSL